MQEKIKQITKTVTERLKNANSLHLINDIRVKFLGKNGEVTALFKNLKSCPPEERPKLGQLINSLRNQVERTIEDYEFKVAQREKNQKLKDEEIDITLSKRMRKTKTLHLLNQVTNDISQTFI